MQKANKQTKRILGIDPGSVVMGYGIIDMVGNKAEFVECGIIKPKTKILSEKLGILFTSVKELVENFKPDEFAIENVFVSKNPGSALKLGQARGAAIVAASINNIPVFEYAPNEIKKAVVGKGHASKEQMQMMITMLLNLNTQPVSDAADALSCALCHGNMSFVRDKLK